MSVWLSGTTSGAVNGRCAVVSQDSIGVEAAFTKHEVTVAEHTPRKLAGSDVERGRVWSVARVTCGMARTTRRDSFQR